MVKKSYVMFTVSKYSKTYTLEYSNFLKKQSLAITKINDFSIWNLIFGAAIKPYECQNYLLFRYLFFS